MIYELERGTISDLWRLVVETGREHATKSAV